MKQTVAEETELISSCDSRLETLFAQAMNLKPGQRAGFLATACAGDSRLLHRLEKVLARRDDASRYFDHLNREIAAAAPLELETAVLPTVTIGAYQTTAVIGQGGMGVVYRAQRVDGAFEQQVALKLIHLDMETPAVRARFLAERQLLARLSHPNIARLQDGGVTEEGRPYFVMEYISGQPITEYCRDQGLRLDAILELFGQVIRAVSYLHQNLVVHRDLKPGNVLVTAEGQVKLVDFGIAKLMAESAPAIGGPGTAGMPMTPEYAAPEQRLGDPVTTATDVYALGVVLYELLTGVRPRSRAGDSAASDGHWPPPLPSTQLRMASAASTALVRRVRGDLDNICLMALRPEPDQRYATAEQLGLDLERFRAGEPTVASGPALSYRAGKFIQRNRRALGAAMVIAGLVVFGYWRERDLRAEADASRVVAQEETRNAVAVADWLAELLSSADPAQAQGRELAVTELLDLAAQRLDSAEGLREQPIVESALRLALGNTYRSLGRYDGAREQLERALLLREQQQADSLAVADVLEAQARTEHADFANTVSEPLFRQVIAIRSAELGPEHPSTLEAMHGLASSLWRQGRFEEVDRIDQQVLAGRMRVLGATHPQTLKSRMARATSHYAKGQFVQAQSEYEQILPALKEQLGERHPDVLLLMHNLAATYEQNGDYERAEILGREVLEARTLAIGAEQDSTAMTMQNLGMVLMAQGNLEEAEALLQQAANIRVALGVSAGGALFAQARVADVYLAQNRLDEAERLYKTVLERQRVAHSTSAPPADALHTRLGLLRVRLAQQGAAAVVDDWMALAEEQRGEQGAAHGEYLQTAIQLARVLLEAGQPAAALVHLDAALAERGKNVAASHPMFDEAQALRAKALTSRD